MELCGVNALVEAGVEGILEQAIATLPDLIIADYVHSALRTKPFAFACR